MPETIAISDKGVMLYKKISPATKFSQFIKITGAPATGADAGQIEVTTLDSAIKQYIADRKDIPTMNFTYNYTETNYQTALTVVGPTVDFLYKFQDGSGFVLTAQANTYTAEVGRGSATGGVLNLVVSNIEWKTATQVSALIETPSI